MKTQRTSQGVVILISKIVYSKVPSVFFERIRKFIQLVTWLKKNFQDRTKIDEDINIFDEDMLTMNIPVSTFGALADLVFDGLEQICDGFYGNFDSFPHFVKGLCFLSAIIHSLFEGSLVVVRDGQHVKSVGKVLLFFETHVECILVAET